MKANARSAVEDEAERRGRVMTDKVDEFHFEDPMEAVKYVSGKVRQSSLKRKDIATTGSMSSSTVGNMASGQTRYPRFSTMSGILGALGLEVLFRGRRK